MVDNDGGGARANGYPGRTARQFRQPPRYPCPAVRRAISLRPLLMRLFCTVSPLMVHEMAGSAGSSSSSRLTRHGPLWREAGERLAQRELGRGTGELEDPLGIVLTDGEPGDDSQACSAGTFSARAPITTTSSASQSTVADAPARPGSCSASTAQYQPYVPRAPPPGLRRRGSSPSPTVPRRC